MPPFLPPIPAVSGFKEKIDALTVQGDRLYVGTSTGNLHVYGIAESSTDDDASITLVETKKGLSRRTIDQLGFIKDINSLVALSESVVTLYPLPTFVPPTPLVKAKGAFSFALNTSVQYLLPDGTVEDSSDKNSGRNQSIPTVVTQLVVGCRRKVVIYMWKDGEAQEAQESPLPHSPRAISFMDQDTVCFGYSQTEFVIFSLQSLTATEISTPLPASSSATGMGALTGLTGYMTLGLGAKAKPGVIQIGESETMIAKDNEGFVINLDAKPSRTATWPAPPEEISYVKPYIFSILPADSSGSSSQSPKPSVIIQILSSISLQLVQTLSFPITDLPSTSPAICTLRLITPSPSAKSPLFFVTTPTDRSTATAEGSIIWKLTMKPWADQVDELVAAEKYPDALALLKSIDQAVLPDKEQRRNHIRALNAVANFRAAKFDDAINTFIELDLNPAKVVALYPETIAGRLAVPKSGWITLFGGPAAAEESASTSSAESSKDTLERPEKQVTDLPASSSGTLRGKPKTGLLPSRLNDDDAVSISDKPKAASHDPFHRSVETLLRYLSDRRPKVAGALSAVQITPAQSHNIISLSETSVEDLFSQPNAALTSLTPEQLVRCAQIVDTALFKSYLLIRPGLLGSLCRVANWCEVSEVEEELRAREKFAELIDLYHGKRMHAKALSLLRQLSDKGTDMKERLSPSISYLQKLGPEHLQQVFDSSRWMFEQNSDMAFEIFISEDVELPRQAVADYLEGIDPRICARYLEYLISERKDETAAFHDRLAELYLGMIRSARKRGDEQSKKEAHSKLLNFIDTTYHYQTERLYGILSSEDLFEARAILLGRLGRHDQALELYVYRLQDYLKAEEYCKRTYHSGTETKNVFLTLLRIYLRPNVQTASNLLTPALELVSRHSPRLDAVEVLQLLPPLVTTQDVRTLLLEALRAPVFDTRVIREISKARNDYLSGKLMVLQSKRVKVTESRICPHCHKRIGNSVIAVHAPRGEVTHYQCREAFSQRLREMGR